MIDQEDIVSTLLSQNLPESLKSVRTGPLFLLREAVPPLVVVGQTPNAFRRIGIVTGGSFEGDRLSGEVVTGNDWQYVRKDSCIKLDVRLVLRTTDGALIVMTYQCLRAGTPDVMERLDKSRVRDWLQEIRLDEPHHRCRYRPQAPRRAHLQHLRSSLTPH